MASSKIFIFNFGSTVEQAVSSTFKNETCFLSLDTISFIKIIIEHDKKSRVSKLN